jgi:DNA-binding NarL/FixJ family response regulator
MRVALIDDHALFRSGLALILESALDRPEIAEWASVEAALLGPCGPPDIVLVDHKLDGRTGLEALSDLRACWPAARVIMVSAFPELSSKARDAGFDGFVAKSDPPNRIVAEVRRALPAPLARRGDADDPERPLLTSRQLEILALMRQGCSNKLIARRLFLSEFTVRGHVQAILGALGVSNRQQAVYVAQQHGIIA